MKDDVLFFAADGKYRSKIGLNPKRSKAVLGSYDADNKVLTIVHAETSTGVLQPMDDIAALAREHGVMRAPRSMPRMSTSR